MSPRMQTVSDNQILEATARAIADLGPNRLTLAEIGRRVGLSAATLIQRFGSKRDLLLALASQGTESIADAFETMLDPAHPPLEAIRQFLLCFPASIESPEALSNHLAFLQIDLNDEDFRKHAAAYSQGSHKALCGLIERAIAAGDLRACDAGALAHALQAVSGGSMLGWAIEREGPLVDWVRRDIETVLAPYKIA